MKTALVLMGAAAVQAQYAYMRRLDRPGRSRRAALSAILYAMAGLVCFITVRVVQ